MNGGAEREEGLGEALRRADALREATVRIAHVVTSAQTLRELLERIHEVVAGLMEARSLYVALVDPARSVLTYPYWVDERDPAAPAEEPPGRGLTAYVLRTSQPLLATPEVFAALERDGDVDRVGPDAVDWLGAPLVVAGRTIGVLAVQSYSGTVRYSPGDRDLLVSISAQVALAIDRRRAEEALAAAEERHLAILEALPDLLFVLGRDGRYLAAHAGRPEELAAPREALLATSIQEVLPPAVSAAWLDAIGRCLDGAGMQRLEYTLDVPAGRRTFEGRIVPCGAESVLSVVRDVTERIRNERVLALLHETDRALLRHAPLDEVLGRVCDGLVELLAAPVVWIGLKEPSGAIEPRAVAGRAASFVRESRFRWDENPGGGGPSGRAIREGEPQIVSAIDDVRVVPWKLPAEAFGLGSALSLPLLAPGRTLGVLSVYAAEARAFDDASVALLARFADQVALAVVEREQAERIALQTTALESAANAVVVTDRDGRIEWVNPAFTELTGYGRDEVVGETPRFLRSGIQSAFYYESLWETILSGKVWRGELYNRRKDGAVYVEEQTITPVLGPDGAVRRFVAIKQDVTARRRSEERIRHLALHDPLTELANRRAAEESLEKMVARARRGAASALVLLDLDNFKIVNDSLGHPAGDGVLLELSRLLVSLLRPGDEVARLGGDEFVVLLDGTSTEAARATAERIRRAVDAHRFRVGGRVFDLGISAGVVPVDGRCDASTVLASADAALYAAKERGRNRVVVGDPAVAPSSSLSEVSDWASRVKDALREGRLLLAFQPIFRLATGRPAHYEALLRLPGDEGSLVLPGSFLPAAERFGLMPAVDLWVVEQVLELLGRRDDLEVFVNLSGASVGDQDLLEKILHRVEASALPPGRLAFEITETAAVRDLLAAEAWMRTLRDVGCRFALDDFGMGFSSFAYLQGLPVDYVKIDGSFIRGLPSDATNRALVQAIDSVAHTLGKETIAESVESLDVVPVLRELGVEFGQGFGLGRPLLTLPSAAD